MKEGSLSLGKHFDNARVFKAFCDENRLTILEILQSGEKCACVLLEKLEISQPTLSHHMKILVDSGIVAARKEGRWMYYSVNRESGRSAAEFLRELTTVTIDATDISNEECCKLN
jgi:ArsR family transcriptional regulator